uniref:DinB-like domain-containing protein n=1 Tax=Aureoumbra lagunensis TaxID=44058 RepID=A0A7S3K5R6_9STRA|mmetsp:Transcript_14113/g.21321  ORF Transcript_14113/g.21321 Transcript_14113/m.21321 type:complete len:185 (+) Transcript_14113:31-585(+)
MMCRHQRAFGAMVEQKLMVLALFNKENSLYIKLCPFIGGSVGQHMRHSLDHCTRAADALVSLSTSRTTPILRYDRRLRGLGAETHVVEAANVCHRVRDQVYNALENDDSILTRSVFAQFASEEGMYMDIESTVARELSFVVHHAYHHLAMIRLIALNHLKFTEADLPPNLGRAPATIIFDRYGY